MNLKRIGYAAAFAFCILAALLAVTFLFAMVVGMLVIAGMSILEAFWLAGLGILAVLLFTYGYVEYSHY